MKVSIISTSVLFLIISINSLMATILDAPYQVSIWLNPRQSGISAKHLCNGAIVHERLILTTAECMWFKMPESNVSHPLIPPMISIVAGDLTYPYAKIIRNVIDIKIAPRFNRTTLENDLALLKLSASLPLATRSDIQWIILDDHDHVNHSCIANYNNSSSLVYTTGPSLPIFIMENKFCNNSANSKRKPDICSSYVLQPGSMCNITEENLVNTSDRGTPLVCDSKLYGLLSVVIPPPGDNSTINCYQQRKLNAYFSRVSRHLGWIYEEIAMESSKNAPQGNHVMAPAFIGKNPSPNSLDTYKKISSAGAISNAALPVTILFIILFCYLNIYSVVL